MDLANLTISQPAAWPPVAASESSKTDGESLGTSFDAVLQTSMGDAGAAESAPAIVAPAPDAPAEGTTAPPPAVVTAVPAAPVPTAPVPAALVPAVPVAAAPVPTAPAPAAPVPPVLAPTTPAPTPPVPTTPVTAPVTTAPVTTPAITVRAQGSGPVAPGAAVASGRGVAAAANVMANGALQRTSSSTAYTGREGTLTPEHNPLGAGVRRDDDRDVAWAALQNAARQTGVTYDASDLDDVIRHAWYDANVNTPIGAVIDWYVNGKYAFRAGNIPGAGGVDPTSVSEPSQIWSRGAGSWATSGAAGQRAPASAGPLSPLGEQVKAFLEQGSAGLMNAAWRPISALDLGVVPGAAPDPAAPADRSALLAPVAPVISDKAQAMARAIMRTTVEGLALSTASGAGAATTPDTPAPAAPAGSTEATATTLAPQALGVNALLARHEARAAYRSEQAAADAPVLPPMAAAADAFLDQQAAHGGQGDAPRPDTARPAPEAVLATFALPALGTADPATLSGISGAGLASASPGATTMTELPRQILRSIQVQVRDGVSEARLRLNPEHLGEVTVRVRVESGGVTAILHAESPQVSGWIAAHQDELRSALGEQGLHLDRFTVTTDPEERRQAQEETPRPRLKAPRSRGDARRFEVTL